MLQCWHPILPFCQAAVVFFRLFFKKHSEKSYCWCMMTDTSQMIRRASSHTYLLLVFLCHNIFSLPWFECTKFSWFFLLVIWSDYGRCNQQSYTGHIIKCCYFFCNEWKISIRWIPPVSGLLWKSSHSGQQAPQVRWSIHSGVPRELPS